jgi:NhaP-type Na+/H+ or K+/H+ antiporter
MKKNNILPYVVAAGTLLAPLAVFAQDGTVQGVLGTIRSIMSAIIPLLFGAALIYFVWALIKYVGSQSDDNAKKEARGQMMYGIIILAVMLGVWGLVAILLNTFVPGYDVIPPFPNPF